MTINVTNVNDAPAVSDYNGVISEDTTIGSAIVNVAASDQDTADTLSYAITDGNTGGAFAIDSSGNITTATALDSQTTAQYVLTVTVTDDGSPVLSDTAFITIDVNASFTTWISAYSTGGLSTFEDDADSDGVSNGLEFLFGGDPTVAGDSPKPTTANGAGDSYVYSFTRSARARGVVSITAQVSDDLVSWPQASDTVIGSDTSSSGSGVTITDMGDHDVITISIPSGAERRFIRLKALEL